MFGLSLGKVLLLGLVVVGLWIAFRMFGRKRRSIGDGARRGRGGGGRIAAEDMVACPRCGVFVSARRAVPCQRTDCPYA